MKSLIRYTFLVLYFFIQKGYSQTTYESGISFALAQERANSISNITYAYTFDIPEEKSLPIEASAQIQFHLSDPSKDIALDFTEKTVHSLDINSQKIKPILQSQHIILPKEHLTQGVNTLTIAFTAGNLSLNRNDDFLYTLLVPARASSVFPCFDQPDLKARFQLTLIVPEDWETIANGQKSATTITSHKKKIVYTETSKISTYLFAFAAGKFQTIEREIDGRNFVLYHRETDLEKVNRNLDTIFNQHEKAYQWLEHYTGIQNPYPDYEFVAIPSFQYGGMEHPGAIWYKASSLFLEEDPTRMSQMNRANLIAHEVAHMWFGNLVTMKWFNDVWLKEVFANFMAGKIIEPDFNDLNHSLLFIESNYPSAYRVDRSEGTHPIQQPLENLQDAGSLYGRIIYNKAPIVMKHLENKIGEAVLQKGLQAYLTQYQNSNATWDDLIDILSHVSQKDLSSWNQNWVKSAGMPHYTCYMNEDDELIIESVEHLYEQPLTIEVIHDSKITERHTLILNQLQQKIKLHTATPDFINLFGTGDEYGYYELDSKRIDWLMHHISSETDDTKRYTYWLTLYENFLHAKIPPNALLDTALNAVPTEQNPFILKKILSHIQYLNTVYFPSNNIVRTKSEQTIWNRLRHESNKSVKRSLWDAYQSLASSTEGLNRVYEIWNGNQSIDGLSFSENDRIEMSENLVLNQHPDWETILHKQYSIITNPDRKKRYAFLMDALSNHKSNQELFFKKIKSVENRTVENWVAEGLGFLHHASRTKSSIDYLLPTLELVEEFQQTGDIFFPNAILYNSFHTHSSDEALEVIRSFLANHPDYPDSLKKKILQNEDIIIRSNQVKRTYGFK